MKVRQWPLIVIIAALVAILAILIYDKLKPQVATVEQYLFNKLQAEKDSLLTVIDSLEKVPVPNIIIDDSISNDKLNSIINELRKKPVIVPATDSGLLEYFSRIPR